MRIPCFVALVVIVMTSTGCVSNAVPRARLAGVERVGVVIVTDQGMHGVCVGTTVCNNEKWDAPEVHLDTRSWARREFLAASPTLFKFFEDTPETAGVLSDPYQPSFLVPSRPSPDELKRFGEKEGVQLIVILTSGQTGDFMGQTSAALPCHGYYHRGVFGIHYDYAYFAADVRVFDARDGEPLRDSMALGMFKLKDIVWAGSWSGLAPANQAVLKTKVEAAAHAAVAAKIKELGLTGHP